MPFPSLVSLGGDHRSQKLSETEKTMQGERLRQAAERTMLEAAIDALAHEKEKAVDRLHAAETNGQLDRNELDTYVLHTWPWRRCLYTPPIFALDDKDF